jgi:hypothetical protein
MGHHEAQSWAVDMARSGGDMQWHGQARRRGWGEEGLICGVHMSVRKEREGD